MSKKKDKKIDKNKDKKKAATLVTLIEDPFKISTLEVAKAQLSDEPPLEESLDEDPNENESEDLDALNSPTDSIPEISSEEIDEQFNKISEALTHQDKSTDLAESYDEALQQEAENLLQSQIEEDQALEKEIEQRVKEFTPDPEIAISLDSQEIQSCLEALLFLSDKPISLKRFQEMLGASFPEKTIEEALQTMQKNYQSIHHGIELLEISGGYQFRTKPGRMDLAKKLAKVQTQRLSTGAMETLSIVAYKQPIMKEEIDKIRGVDSSYFVRGLMERKLIQISGRSELPGRPMLYSTTSEFLEIFGLKDLNSLPSLRELEQMIPGSQTKNPEEEDPRVIQLRKMVSAMKADRTGSLHYNPEEDDKILKEIRARVSAIPSSTPYLDELKAAEALTEQQEKQDQHKS